MAILAQELGFTKDDRCNEKIFAMIYITTTQAIMHWNKKGSTNEKGQGPESKGPTINPVLALSRAALHIRPVTHS